MSTTRHGRVIEAIKSQLDDFTRNHMQCCELVLDAESRFDALEGLLLHLEDGGNGATSMQLAFLRQAFESYRDAKAVACCADRSLGVLRCIDRLTSQ